VDREVRSIVSRLPRRRFREARELRACVRAIYLTLSVADTERADLDSRAFRHRPGAALGFSKNEAELGRPRSDSGDTEQRPLAPGGCAA
jgi:hypothetical protein